MSVLGFIILNTHIMDQTWKKQLCCSGFSFSSSARHANQAPVWRICTDLTNNAWKKVWQQPWSLWQEKQLSGCFTIIEAECSNRFKHSVKVINACKTTDKFIFGAGLHLRGCFFHVIPFNSLNLEMCRLKPANRSTRMADIRLYSWRFIRRSDTQPPTEPN